MKLLHFYKKLFLFLVQKCSLNILKFLIFRRFNFPVLGGPVSYKYAQNIFQDDHYKDVCNAPVAVVTLLAPDNVRFNSMAMEIQEKFTGAFEYFSNCHMLFNSSKAVDPDQLGKPKTRNFLNFEKQLFFIRCV